MALDEALFARLHRWWTGRRRRVRAAHELPLDEAAARRTKLLWLLCGRELPLVFGDGVSRLGERVVLPASLPMTNGRDDAEAVVLLRLALAAAAQATGTAASTAVTVEGAAARWWSALPHLWAWLDAEWPGARALWPAVERHLGASGSTMTPLACMSLLGTLPVASGGDAQRAVSAAASRVDRTSLPSGTERRNGARRDVEVVTVEARDDGANPLAHVFEKVKTAEEHTGGNRTMDGSDELDAHLEALEDLDLRRVVRSRTSTSSVFRSEIDFVATVADLSATAPQAVDVVHYDEWDDRRRRYLPGWCAVAETMATAVDAETAASVVGPVRAQHARRIGLLRAEFARLVRGRTLQNRQPVGNDIDLDAIVERHGDLWAARRGRAVVGETRLYAARRPAPRDVAITLLLDRSLSSDSWVGGRRVLDVTRQAVLVLGEVLWGMRLPVAVAAFCSHTRNDCRYEVVKAFDGDWRTAERRLVGIRPDGYTRIGPALRHAAAQLAKRPAQRRLLFVLSDCKPVDYDHYEGRRGIGDVRQAVREARRLGVETMALAIDRAAGAHLPQMFGRAGFRVLPDAGQLVHALVRLHERLMRR